MDHDVRQLRVDLEARSIAPFCDHRTDPLKRFLLRLNLRRFQRGRRFLAHAITRLLPALRTPAFDVENPEGLRARVIFDNFHDVWFCERGAALEQGFRDCLRTILTSDGQDSSFYVLDIGGNTGIVSSIAIHEASRRLGDRAALCVAVVEPQADLIERLATNLIWNRRQARLTLYCCAVGDQFGTASMVINGKNRGGSQIDPTGKGTARVPLVPLAALVADLDWPRLDLLKIDVEGHEYAALAPFFAKVPDVHLPRFVYARIKTEPQRLRRLLDIAGYDFLWEGEEDAFFRRRPDPAA